MLLGPALADTSWMKRRSREGDQTRRDGESKLTSSFPSFGPGFLASENESGVGVVLERWWWWLGGARMRARHLVKREGRRERGIEVEGSESLERGQEKEGRRRDATQLAVFFSFIEWLLDDPCTRFSAEGERRNEETKE